MNRITSVCCVALLIVAAHAGVAHAATVTAATDTAGLVPDPSRLAMYGLAGVGLLYRKLRPHGK